MDIKQSCLVGLREHSKNQIRQVPRLSDRRCIVETLPMIVRERHCKLPCGMEALLKNKVLLDRALEFLYVLIWFYKVSLLSSIGGYDGKTALLPAYNSA